MTAPHGLPPAQGLYDPRLERDSCGVGFVADVRGRASHQLVLDALTVLRNMAHRGATGSEPNSGDGAGILTGLPHALLSRVARADLGVTLPEPGAYAAGNVFLPTDPDERAHCKRTLERIAEEQGQRVLGWRALPIDPDEADLGPSARASMPRIEQVFIAAGERVGPDELERQLYVIRKRAHTGLRNDARLRQARLVYFCTLSSKVIVYKGMLTPAQLLAFYPDLADWEYRSHLAMVHSRFSTNTFPTWDRAQPMRAMCHNGEINTLRGNVNSMHDREARARSPLFEGDIDKLFPIAEPDTSDSGNFDNVLELLVRAGRPLPHAMMMMVPEAWQQDASMNDAKRAFYEYHSCFMEPWDGPASIVFTDGDSIGATLDRNGLRPSRYYVTTDDRVVMASEVGVLDIPPERVRLKGRLRPGKMLLVDFKEQRLVPDDEIKARVAAERPYRAWLDAERVRLSDLSPGEQPSGFEPQTLVPRLRAFGYTAETMQHMLRPMIAERRDPLGSMGNDAALACLSDQPRMLYDYFKQQFAQVTNPPIDSIREEVIMSLASYMGPEKNVLGCTPQHAHRIYVPHPILTNQELSALRTIDHRGWRARTIDVTWSRKKGAAGLDASLRRIAAEAEAAVDAGFKLLVLSDRRVGPGRVPISTLLAVGAVHQHLVRRAKRTRIGIVVETGEAREVHHHACLIGFGCDAINPYLAFEALYQARRDGLVDPAIEDDAALSEAYRSAVAKGLLKVMGKMGISTLQSYKGAQIFEAIGLSRAVVDHCFTGTLSRIEGVGFDVLAEEAVRRHELGYPTREGVPAMSLPDDGQHHYRAGGEKHMWSPTAIATLRRAARDGDDDAYAAFAQHANGDARARCTLRGLLELRPTTPIPLDEVEPAAEIVRRFATGAMSFGSLSEEAHTTLARAMNSLGGKSNSGEGGEDPARYRLLESGEPNPRRSRIKQVASGRFGVTIDYLASADELQIKMAQGAKPGEGGELPGRKVDAKIAAIRHSTPGVGLISPPPHHDIYSIEDLAQLIHDLEHANPRARISVKLVSQAGVGTVAAGVAKAHAGHVLISGHDGGTGASPLTSIKHAGMPWELGIAEAHQTLCLNGLRERVVIQVDGQLKTGRDVVIAALLGAEEFGFSTAPLVALGCVMMRKCHLNTCPVGIATQDPELRRRFDGAPEHVVRYLFAVAEEARTIMARLGFRSVREMVGRVEVLRMADPGGHWKAQGVDLSALLTPASRPARAATPTRARGTERRRTAGALDHRLLELAEPAIARGQRVEAELAVRNTDRVVGGMLSHAIATRRGPAHLPDDTVRFRLRGSAGQSFGAWLAGGVTLELEGDANDHVGKGLSGGRVVVYPPRASVFHAHENVLVGNVALYGATAGEAFLAGQAAERFAVRNSGATAVVEGVGDHGCEYMTGGRVLVLGPVGRNFAAGMSGGVAYLLDPRGASRAHVNPAMVDLEPLDADDEALVRGLLEAHLGHTRSALAARLLEGWSFTPRQLVKVMPRDYRRALEAGAVAGHAATGVA